MRSHGALAARDHTAFSTMPYAGLRIEETTALTVEDLSFARAAEEVRMARGKGNKGRVVPTGPRLRRPLVALSEGQGRTHRRWRRTVEAGLSRRPDAFLVRIEHRDSPSRIC